MKRNLFKKLAAAAGAAVMALTLVMPMGVSAANETIDTNRSVSLTIEKHEGNSIGRSESVTGKMDSTVQGNKMKDVEFTAVKIADIAQSTANASTTVEYKLTTEGAQILGGSAQQNETKTGTELNQWLESQTVSGLVTALGNITNNKFFGTTNEQGIVTFTDDSSKISKNELNPVDITHAGQGLYLIVETDAPNTVTQRSVPFIVSLPMTEKLTSDEQANSGKTQEWMYEVYAYPKNSTGTVDIEKEISKVDTSDQTEGTTKAKANIGDEITYTVTYQVPVQENGLSELKVVDTMDKGLDFDQNNGIVSIKRTTIEHTADLTKDTDYTVSTTGKTEITINFEKYLSNLQKSTTESFEITYKATLNGNAVLGQTGNKNTVQLEWKNNGETTTNTEPGNDTTVFTYGIDLVKKGESDTLLKDVQFTLTDENNIAVNIKKDITDTYYIPGDNSNTITTNDQGKISIRGLAPGTYKLTETKTNSGYVLLKDPVVIKIEQTDSTTGAAKAYVNNSSTETTMTPDNLNTGSNTAKVEVTVVNNKGFDLPQTGAAGTAIFAIAGIVLVAVAGALLIFRRKTQK